MPCGFALRNQGSREREPATYSFLFAFVPPSAHPRSFNVTLQLIYLIRGGAPLLNLCDARRINFHGDFDVKNKFCNKHLLSCERSAA